MFSIQYSTLSVVLWARCRPDVNVPDRVFWGAFHGLLDDNVFLASLFGDIWGCVRSLLFEGDPFGNSTFLSHLPHSTVGGGTQKNIAHTFLSFT